MHSHKPMGRKWGHMSERGRPLLLKRYPFVKIVKAKVRIGTSLKLAQHPRWPRCNQPAARWVTGHGALYGHCLGRLRHITMFCVGIDRGNTQGPALACTNARH